MQPDGPATVRSDGSLCTVPLFRFEDDETADMKDDAGENHSRAYKQLFLHGLRPPHATFRCGEPALEMRKPCRKRGKRVSLLEVILWTEEEQGCELNVLRNV